MPGLQHLKTNWKREGVGMKKRLYSAKCLACGIEGHTYGGVLRLLCGGWVIFMKRKEALCSICGGKLLKALRLVKKMECKKGRK
jgi:hypothetical protein